MPRRIAALILMAATLGACGYKSYPSDHYFVPEDKDAKCGIVKKINDRSADKPLGRYCFDGE